MKIFFLILCFWSFSVLQAQDILGNWRIINTDTGELRSIINIYEKEGKIFGRVIKIADETKRDNLCTDCEGEDKNKRIEGMVLVKNFRQEGEEYVDGTITNPDDGKVYTSKLWLDKDNPNILNVRGYIGIFYKTMHWERSESIE